MRLKITTQNLYCDWSNTIVDNDAKLVITFINLTCIIELKYMSVGIILRFDYGVRLIVPRLANERDPE